MDYQNIQYIFGRPTRTHDPWSIFKTNFDHRKNVIICWLWLLDINYTLYIYNIIYIIHIHSKNKLQDFPPIQSVGSRTLSSKKTCLISSSGNTSGSSSTTHRSPEVVSKHGKHGKHDDTWSFPMVNTV